MNGDTYLIYLKLFPTKRPGLVLWSHLIMWLAAFGVNLYVLGRDYNVPLWHWTICLIAVIWSIAGIWHWTKMLWSKRQIDKLLKV